MSGSVYHVSVTTRTKAPSRRGHTLRSHSAAATARYISRVGEYAKGHDTVLHVESGHMPAWAERGRTVVARRAAIAYWFAADVHERRNGRLAQSVIVALPTALTLERQVTLSRAIAVALTSGITGGKLPWTLAIHAGQGSNGRSSNPHCHILISERINDGIERAPGVWFRRASVRLKGGRADSAKGGARKTLAIRSRAWLLAARAMIGELINRSLKAAGLLFRVDHRANTARGLAREPQPKLGWPASWLERQGVRTAQGDAVLRVMRAWKGVNLPTGPLLATREGVTPRSKTGVLPVALPKRLPDQVTPQPQEEFVPTPTAIGAQPALRHHPALRRPKPLWRPPSVTPSGAAGCAWTLILTSEQATGADVEAERNRLGELAYEERMKWRFGNRLKDAALLRFPVLHRMLSFSDGVRVSDYAERVEMTGNEAGPSPDVLAELITEGKRWATVRVAGSESARRAAWLFLSAKGVQVLGYESSVQDTELLKRATRVQVSSTAARVEWSTATSDYDPRI